MAAEKHCELVEDFNELTMLLSRHNRTFFSCSTHQLEVLMLRRRFRVWDSENVSGSGLV